MISAYFKSLATRFLQRSRVENEMETELRAHIQLRADGRLDGDLEGVGAGHDDQRCADTREQTNASCDH